MKQLFTTTFFTVFLVLCLTQVQAQDIQSNLSQDQLESVADSLLETETETEIEVVILMVPTESATNQDGLLRISSSAQSEVTTEDVLEVTRETILTWNEEEGLMDDQYLLAGPQLLHTIWTPITTRISPLSWPLSSFFASTLR